MISTAADIARAKERNHRHKEVDDIRWNLDRLADERYCNDDGERERARRADVALEKILQRYLVEVA